MTERLAMGCQAVHLQPDDESAWKAVAKNYTVTNKITNLENGYWGIVANPVLAEYKQLTEFINKGTDFCPTPTREAGVSIKPGVERSGTPGTRRKK